MSEIRETQCMHCNTFTAGPRAGTNPGEQIGGLDSGISHGECPYGAEGKTCPYGRSPLAEYLEQKRRGNEDNAE